MNLDFEAFVDSLQYMGKGMLGVFLVIIIIILSIYLMNFIFKPRSK